MDRILIGIRRSPRSHSRAPDMTLSMCMMSLLHVHDT